MIRARERPALFKGPMVRAIAADVKTQTRRILKPQPQHVQRHEHKGRVIYDGEHRLWCWKDLTLENIWDFPDNEDRRTLSARCPYGVPGDKLWVRETLRLYDSGAWYYDADAEPLELELDDPRAPEMISWAHHNERDYCPSIFMPRWASRYLLNIVGVTVQKLQEITEADARAEGVTQRGVWWDWGIDWQGDGIGATAREAFALRWNEINGRGSWESNPWVWRIEFWRSGEDEVRKWNEEQLIRAFEDDMRKHENAMGWGYE